MPSPISQAHKVSTSPGIIPISATQPTDGRPPVRTLRLKNVRYDRPAYNPAFIFDYQRLLMGKTEQVKVDWTGDRGVFSFSRNANHFPPQTELVFYILDASNRFVNCLRFSYEGLLTPEEIQERRLDIMGRIHGDEQRILSIEDPLAFHSIEKDGRRLLQSSYVHVVRVRNAQSLISPDSPHLKPVPLAEIQSKHRKEVEVLPAALWNQKTLELSYMVARFAQRAPEKTPHDFSESAMRRAFERLHPNSEELREKYVRFAPIAHSQFFQMITGAAEVIVIDDSEQYQGSFKVRGAHNKLMAYLEDAVRVELGARVAPSNGEAIGASPSTPFGLGKIPHKTREEIAGETAVIAASHGNHAQGVMLATKNLGFKETLLVLPLQDQTQKVKIRACLKLGAMVMLHGKNLFESMEMAERLTKEGLKGQLGSIVYLPGSATDAEIDRLINAGRKVILWGDPDKNDVGPDQIKKKVAEFPEKRVFVHTYNDPDVAVGQGTSSMELIADRPHLIQGAFTYVAPAGGLGKLAGDSTYLQSVNPEARIVGINRENRPEFSDSLKAGKKIVNPTVFTAPEDNTSADGTDVPDIGEDNLNQLLKLNNVSAGLVRERWVQEALVLLEIHPWFGVGEKAVAKRVEGSTASVVAAIANGIVKDLKGQRVVLAFTGKNIDDKRMALYHQKHGWVKDVDMFMTVASARSHLVNHYPAEEAKKWLDQLDLLLDNPSATAALQQDIANDKPHGKNKVLLRIQRALEAKKKVTEQLNGGFASTVMNLLARLAFWRQPPGGNGPKALGNLVATAGISFADGVTWKRLEIFLARQGYSPHTFHRLTGRDRTRLASLYRSGRKQEMKRILGKYSELARRHDRATIVPFGLLNSFKVSSVAFARALR